MCQCDFVWLCVSMVVSVCCVVVGISMFVWLYALLFLSVRVAVLDACGAMNFIKSGQTRMI